MRREIEQIVNEGITEAFKKAPELKNFLLKHERKALFVNNMCQQIKIIERSKFRIKFEKRMYLKTILQMTQTWAKQALDAERDRRLTENEKQRRIKESEELDQFEKENEDMTKDLLSQKIQVFT